MARQYYLKALRQDDFADALRELYIGSAQPLADTPVAANVDIGDAAPAEAAPADAPVAYPMVQPMRAALYFDSADGFGEWRVLIAQNADRDLREARNKAPGLFKIYLKKIKCARPRTRVRSGAGLMTAAGSSRAACSRRTTRSG
jgi:hypothetical protein